MNPRLPHYYVNNAYSIQNVCIQDYYYIEDVMEAKRLVCEKAVTIGMHIGSGDEIAILKVLLNRQ
ncbi:MULTISPECIES: hypothetical protein [Listeriaceae]|uniref:hypothetical protein n=1 Tax=Listeria TaxID=1637 RepID=UPI000F5FD740|nr:MULTISPECIES: hypothetical protein [Listeria]WAO21879.2 hypothetical protein OTR81_00850 [Listeria newyorkensis]